VADDPLATYLSDHLAGAVAGLELATKLSDDNAGTPLGDALGGLRADIDADKATLERLMEDVGVPRSPVKRAGATVIEKLGRLRFHEQVTGSGALSRLLEMESLAVGIQGKEALWRALAAVAPSRPELSAVPLEELAERARQQRATLEPLRLAAAQEALGRD
jgi:uncharacterized protein (UPF0147 family)